MPPRKLAEASKKQRQAIKSITTDAPAGKVKSSQGGRHIRKGKAGMSKGEIIPEQRKTKGVTNRRLGRS